MEKKIKYEVNLDVSGGKKEKSKMVTVSIYCSPEEKQMIYRLVKRTGASSPAQMILHLLKQIND